MNWSYCADSQGRAFRTYLWHPHVVFVEWLSWKMLGQSEGNRSLHQIGREWERWMIAKGMLFFNFECPSSVQWRIFGRFHWRSCILVARMYCLNFCALYNAVKTLAISTGSKIRTLCQVFLLDEKIAARAYRPIVKVNVLFKLNIMPESSTALTQCTTDKCQELQLGHNN